jgi:septal ring factor EnvC (AmiA/AmiB activator)
VVVSVKGPNRVRVQRAANVLAYQTVGRVSTYVNSKIATLKLQLASLNRELASLDRRVAAANAALVAAKNRDPFDQYVLLSQIDNAEQRRAAVEGEQLSTKQLLNLANQIERARVIDPAIAVATTARSKRNSMLVGGLIGLLLGTIAALLWEPVVERRNRK